MIKKTIIFDLYGVLFFLRPLVILRQIGIKNTCSFLWRYSMTPYTMYYIILDKMRLEMPGEFQETIAYRGRFLPQSFCEWQRGKVSKQIAFEKITQFITTLGKQNFFKDQNDADLVQGFFAQAFDTKTRIPAMYVNKRLVKTIKNLKKSGNYKLVMLTNIDHELLHYLQHDFPEVFNLFDDVIASCQVELMKPQAEIFEFVLNRHTITKENALFFDDQHENIIAAQKAGLPAVVYHKGLDIKQYLL